MIQKTFRAAGILLASLLAASIAQAEGLYYGASLGYTKMTSTSDGIGETVGDSAVIGGVLGYRSDLTGGQFWAAELDVDFVVDGEMSYDDGGASCTSRSPDWCDIDMLSRVRGIYGLPAGGGYDFFMSAGLAFVTGLAEDGPGVYVDTSGTGYTAGLGVQRALSGGGTARVELIYDSIGNTDPDAYEKTLKNVGLVASAVF